jgi:hypothetical protein
MFVYQRADHVSDRYVASSVYRANMPIDVTVVANDVYNGILLYLSPATNLSMRVGTWRIPDCRFQPCQACGTNANGITHTRGQKYEKLERFQVTLTEEIGELVLSAIIVKAGGNGTHIWDIQPEAARITPMCGCPPPAPPSKANCTVQSLLQKRRDAKSLAISS